MIIEHMTNIYTITAIGLWSNKYPEKAGQHRKRIWGWYSNFYEAEEAVIENVTDMNEAGYYPWIVIEEVSEGICPITMEDKAKWYEFDAKDEKYHRCDAPEFAMCIINWSFG